MRWEAGNELTPSPHLASSQGPLQPQRPRPPCVSPLSSSMVPFGRLLAFYVRENGEGVADSLRFSVKAFLETQVEG